MSEILRSEKLGVRYIARAAIALAVAAPITAVVKRVAVKRAEQQHKTDGWVELELITDQELGCDIQIEQDEAA